jgi:hypothetical protein
MGGLNRCSSIKQRGRPRFEVHGSLHAGLDATRDENPLKVAVAEMRRGGLKCVLACIERHKAESSVLRCCCAGFSASGLVAEDDRDACERARMKIGEAADQGTELRRLDFYGMREKWTGRARLSEDYPPGAQA